MRWLALLFIIFFLGVIGYSFFLAKSTFTSTPTTAVSITMAPSPSPTTATQPNGGRGGMVTFPMQIANNFYTAYLDCLKNPPEAASGQVSIYCQSHNQFGASSLPANLEKGGIAKAGADAILCAQNPPESVQAKDSLEGEGGITTVTMNETFGSGNPQEIKVDLESEKGEWKVTDIHCPKP